MTGSHVVQHLARTTACRRAAGSGAAGLMTGLSRGCKRFSLTRTPTRSPSPTGSEI
jgi:hypothetical protein